MPRRNSGVQQRTLAFPQRGGARRGAGRKPKGVHAGVSHRTRPALSSRHPVHVTVRIRDGLPRLRCERTKAVLERAFSAGGERFGFRLVHYSIQTTHLHLVAEAGDQRALSRGMQGLLVRTARALNRIWARKGKVFSDRYHARPLRSPLEVRRALVYVLHNARHHGLWVTGVDAYSSGPWFDGWAGRALATGRAPPCVPARSWLLRLGWRRHGLLHITETPRRVPA